MILIFQESTSLLEEGLNRVNRQPSTVKWPKKLTVNRQKRNIFTVNRQMNESKLFVKILGYA